MSAMSLAIETSRNQVSYVLNRRDLNDTERELIEQARQLMNEALAEARLHDNGDGNART
jgi:hypothetical protein